MAFLLPPVLNTVYSLRGLLVPLAIWGLLLLFVLSLFLAIEDGARRLRRLHQVPCDRCRYATGSPYLKCPVHPLTAFSEAAIHCGDYERIAQPRPCNHPQFLKEKVEAFLKTQE